MQEPYHFLPLEEARQLLREHFGIEGQMKTLAGEVDANFKVKTNENNFLLKISRSGTDEEFLLFQQNILKYLEQREICSCIYEDGQKEQIWEFPLETPELFQDLKQQDFVRTQRSNGEKIYLRLLSWVEGKLWSDLRYYDEKLLYSLGSAAGALTASLAEFRDVYAQRTYAWDINNAGWTQEYQHYFKGRKKEQIKKFHRGFKNIASQLKSCRHSVVHNDSNDNNIIVTPFDQGYRVKSIIDFGDAVYTATINDLAVCITYAVMDQTNPLEAAIPIVKGYHRQFPLEEKELELLYWLVGARLIISLTQSALNREKEPENDYLIISEKPALLLLEQWDQISPETATAFFRKACGYEAHRNYSAFKAFAQNNRVKFSSLFKTQLPVEEIRLDLSSATIPNLADYRDPKKLKHQIREINSDQKMSLLTGGYGEVRPDFMMDEQRVETNSGSYWKAKLLGTQAWQFEVLSLSSPFDGKVVYKDSWRLFVAHAMEISQTASTKPEENELYSEGKTGGDQPGRPEALKNGKFHLLYSNVEPAATVKVGEMVKRGDFLGIVKSDDSPFFLQLMLQDPLDTSVEVSCLYQNFGTFQELYPDPALLFEDLRVLDNPVDITSKIMFRKKHLGKSLSLSYKQPLEMLRGEGVFLIDHTGRRYMDLVNNVAHVGHEHPNVVKAGQAQMAMLNTNSRYLHDNILELSENLLSTFPVELSVVHFVNSGSEANELAIRMAKAYTGEKDFISMQLGYHGNSNACIDISSYKFDGKGGKGAPAHTHVVPLPDTLRGKYCGANAGEKYASHVRELVQQLRDKGLKPAAFIAESIISCAGQIELPDNFLKEAYEVVRDAGGLCIADEVQVGCGRVGTHFWGFEHHGVVPDIVTIGKPLGNGHPLAAVVCTQEVAEAFANGMEYFNTFGGNPVSCAIGNAVLQVLKEEKLQENALHTGNFLKEELKKMAAKHPVIADVRGQGLFLGFELLDREKNPLSKQANALVQRMKERGYLMSTEGPDDNVLKIKPPMSFDQEHANQFLKDLNLVLTADFFQL
ncbi:aminotransferase class III-fold pyridoxal phosphate-dependent enzyme [Salinimicrobium sediminilitoris]|uniref:aminotransferase class III-fold pyridoxal phosphate-dependent enzyme n=1 Tax=Salinimicrobium sediminilitoris TaxID=2876715 RepID=UPI001E441983|nr:aminotransferase class III-fold pyridoxal phosphate-dependent enzyme [Salinimicrobium sediminilitoris]MCC8360615.1 aminotransferase class III-fold pyridoxal phosphate-dependent enzyme [Salinimicrobium sediminilitoris]